MFSNHTKQDLIELTEAEEDRILVVPEAPSPGPFDPWKTGARLKTLWIDWASEGLTFFSSVR